VSSGLVAGLVAGPGWAQRTVGQRMAVTALPTGAAATCASPD